MPKVKYFRRSECDESKKSLLRPAIGGSTISCAVMVFCYVVKQRQHSNILTVIDKHILYILHARRLSIKYKYSTSSILAMDEISV